jgi:UDP-glucose 4-epimerase
MQIFITGGAGFIGSHLTLKMLSLGNKVTVYDNFSNGHKWHLEEAELNNDLKIIDAEISDEMKLSSSMAGHDVVFHLASNADIAKAAEEPSIDFLNGTCLTHFVLEAMRKNSIKKIIYTSGSGVYGEVPQFPVPEDYSKTIPISTYGAQKLASEMLISAYSFMFDITGITFRFANVVGPRQTHGVAYDFLRRLFLDPSCLRVLGDGSQSKPYIHVNDVVNAFILVQNKYMHGYHYFNVASEDALTVKEIADLACDKMNLHNVSYNYSGGSRGWRADVPFYRLDTTKIKSIGWIPTLNSKEAVSSALESMIVDIQNGKIKLID